MLLKATVCSAFYLLTIKSLTSSKSVLEEKFKYENWEITNSQRPVVSMTITDGDFKLLDSDETHKAYTWQGFIEGVTCNDYRHNPSYIFKCKAPFPIKWYIQTTFGKHFWGPDSQQFQNPLKTSETLNGLNFTYESVVSFSWTCEVLVKCINVNHPDIFSTYDSYCHKMEVEDFEIDGPFMNNYEDNVRTIELSGTRANLLQWLTADPKWIRWQGGMENWPLILLPCPVRNHEDNAVLKYKLNDNYVRLPMESEENFEWNPQFGFVFRKETDPENYSTWKSTTFRCQVEYSYITVEPLDLDYPIVVIEDTRNSAWPFRCGMKAQSENNQIFIESKGGELMQESQKCESIRSCEVERRNRPKDGIPCMPHNGKRNETIIQTGLSKMCSPKDIPMYGEVHCFTRIDLKEWNLYDFGLARFFFHGLDEEMYILPTLVPSDAVIRISGGGVKVSTNTTHEISCLIVTYFLKPIVKFAVKLDNGNYELLNTEDPDISNNSHSRKLNLNAMDSMSILQVTVELYMKPQYRAITCFAPQQITSEWWNATTEFALFTEKSMDIRVPIVGASFLLIVLTALLTLVIFKYRQGKLRNLTPDEVNQFFEGNCSKLDKEKGGNQIAGLEDIIARPFTKIINSSDITIDFRSLLGKGEFGLVYKGDFYGLVVAVKTVKPSADIDMFKAILEEIKIMDYIGEHPNIIKFLGAETSNIQKKEIWIVLELSSKGNLREYLRNFQQRNDIHISENNKYDHELSTHTLISWCQQIACAMKYLEELKVIHGDLAARNILVFDTDKIKISDFGLSKRLYENPLYRKKTRGKIPWRWLALESLKFQEFSHKSDVWSFGITAWEIFTFGQVPYNEFINCSSDFVKQLESGLRLRRLEIGGDEIYEVLLKCWSANKNDRPSFTALQQYFGDLSGIPTDYI